MELSKELQEIKKTCLGYRTENYGGSGVRNLREILRFEIGELDNNDTLLYAKEHFGFPLNEEELENISTIEEGKSLADELYDFICKKTGFESPQGVWLTTESAVKEYYQGNDSDTDIYHIREDLPVLSDLGPEGCLFIYDKLF